MASQHDSSSVDRFSASFNAVDRSSGRPYSWGVPDGVWLITILYSLLVIGTVLRVAVVLLFTENSRLSLELVTPTLVTGVLFMPPLVLLFYRSKLAVVWMSLLALAFLAVAILAGITLHQQRQLGTGALVGLGAFVAAQVYIAVYTYRLKKDRALE